MLLTKLKPANQSLDTPILASIGKEGSPKSFDSPLDTVKVELTDNKKEKVAAMKARLAALKDQSN